MDTIRTKNKGKKYFLSKLSKFAKEHNKTAHVGHLHKYVSFNNYTVYDSAGFSGMTYKFDYNNNTFLIVADLHIGVKKNYNNIISVIKHINSTNFDYLVFLGDTLDLISATDQYIMQFKGFWDIIKRYKEKVIYICGNHDIALLEPNNPIRQKLLQNIEEIHRIYYYKNIVFLHGDIFDFYLKKFGLLYYLLFLLGDYWNRSYSSFKAFFE